MKVFFFFLVELALAVAFGVLKAKQILDPYAILEWSMFCILFPFLSNFMTYENASRVMSCRIVFVGYLLIFLFDLHPHHEGDATRTSRRDQWMQLYNPNL